MNSLLTDLRMLVRRSVFCLAIFAQCVLANSVIAADEHQQVEVSDPFIDLRTGAGRSYPIFYVVERGEKVEILKRRTDWFKVRATNGKEGWVQQAQMEKTLTMLGEKLHFAEITNDDFSQRKWEFGVMGGDFNGASAMSVYGGYSFNESLSSELALSEVLDDFSDSLLLNISLLSQPFPNWRASPFFLIGVGLIDTQARKTLVQSTDTTDQTAIVGAGFRMHLSKRFIFRTEYKNYIAFTSRDNNKEFNEWKTGFAVFF
jgi:uncharacterized protein YgiM (DUF1202 family)